jgi:hypothetical protein
MFAIVLRVCTETAYITCTQQKQWTKTIHRSTIISFEQVGQPVLELRPHDVNTTHDVNTVQTVIHPDDNERPTIWSRQFKLRKTPRLTVYMFSKGNTGPANNFLNMFANLYDAPKCGICNMQFKIDDDIVDHTTFLDVYDSHRDLEFTNNHYDGEIGTFLTMFQDKVEKSALTQAAGLGENL